MRLTFFLLLILFCSSCHDDDNTKIESCFSIVDIIQTTDSIHSFYPSNMDLGSANITKLYKSYVLGGELAYSELSEKYFIRLTSLHEPDRPQLFADVLNLNFLNLEVGCYNITDVFNDIFNDNYLAYCRYDLMHGDQTINNYFLIDSDNNKMEIISIDSSLIVGKFDLSFQRDSTEFQSIFSPDYLRFINCEFEFVVQ